jgi:acetyl-CoA synthetase
MAGYRIGPVEIESLLLVDVDIAEVAVVGLPDEIRGEVIAAFVVLREGVTASDELDERLQRLAREHLGAHLYPRVIRYVDSLPRTPSGKLQRFLLRESEDRDGRVG